MGTENFRVWLNVYMPGEGTNGLHYHNTDETFTVIEGSGHVVTEEPKREQVFKAAADFINSIERSS